MQTGDRRVICGRTTAAVAEAIDRAAARADMTRSAWVRAILAEAAARELERDDGTGEGDDGSD